MPSVTFDSQSLMIDGRRVWLAAASLDYGLTPPETWRTRIADVRQCGFNTVLTTAPWLLHEPRQGRFDFEGQADIRQFMGMCADAGLRVVLRAGPFVGPPYTHGALPPWLLGLKDVRVRQANQAFLKHVNQYFKKLTEQVSSMQASAEGPLIMLQAEHAWTCANPVQTATYLDELARVLRENGIAVPIMNANDLWPESDATIDTWRGFDDLLIHLRQLRTIQPDHPRFVSAFNPGAPAVWDEEMPDVPDAAAVLRQLAEVFAAGAQPMVVPFHNVPITEDRAGRLAGGPGRFLAPMAGVGSILGAGGGRSDRYAFTKRLITFGNHFGHVFADLHADYHPITIDTTERSPGFSIVPLRGNQGRVVFVFARGRDRKTTLVLDDGLHMPIDLGDQSVGWFVLDVDLHGAGKLEYSNLMPYAMINRRLLIVHGPARSTALMSIDGSPIEATVPGGKKPLLVPHRNITVVICNHAQIDAMCDDGETIYIGATRLDEDNRPRAPRATDKVWSLTAGADPKMVTPVPEGTTPRPITPKSWRCAPATDQVRGTSPRFAGLDGPQTLDECGVVAGYGWYRIEFRSTSARKHLCLWPQVADRAHLFTDDTLMTTLGVGPGASAGTFDFKPEKGDNVIVALVDHVGHFCEGSDLMDRKGLFGHLYEVKSLGAVKPKALQAAPVDAFQLQGFISGRTADRLSDPDQVAWTFTHAKKAPIIVATQGAGVSGTWILNDQLLAYHAGTKGADMQHLVLDPGELEPFKRGRNVLRFAPDPLQEDAVAKISKATTLYECIGTLDAKGTWSFAKWEPPKDAAFGSATKPEMGKAKGRPCWWRTTFNKPGAEATVWLDVTGLSCGRAMVNGRTVGHYFTSTATGRKIGPVTRLAVPRAWLRDGEPNDLLIFDEHGFDPSKVRIVFGDDKTIG